MTTVEIKKVQNSLFPELEPTEKELVQNKIKALATEYFIKNQEKNKLDREEKACRAELLELLDANNLDTLSFSAEVDGVIKTLITSVTSPIKEEIDVYKLRELLQNEELFMKAIKASKTDVEEVCGKSIIKNCVKNIIGTRNVSVKLGK